MPTTRCVYYVAVFTDIHEAKANQHRLEHLARHDPLTGLANRAEFERHCAEAIAVAERERLAVVVLFIDLDAFKIVNDSYSHAIGDRLLVKVARAHPPAACPRAMWPGASAVTSSPC